MYIKCWGSRGSIPVSGSVYVEHGGDTTCLEIRTKSGDTIIVDAGTGIRRLGNQLLVENRRHLHLIFTHAHWDHVMGFPFFKPIYSPHFSFTVYRCPFSGYVEKMLGQVMKPPFFPVRFSQLAARFEYHALRCPEPFQIGSVTVSPIRLSHPNTGNGFKFTEDGKSLVFITDNELFVPHAGGVPYETYVAFSAGADILIHDGEYTPEEYEKFRGYGHSTYLQALDLALDANVRALGIFHLNQDRTDRHMRHIIRDCNRLIRGKRRKMGCFAVKMDMEFTL